MKKSLIFACLFMYTFTSCNKDNNSTGVQFFEEAPKGNWKITKYIDRSKDETGDYTVCIFSFSDNGNFVASISNENYIGSWKSNLDDSKEKLLISFNNPSLLTELNEDWEILNNISSKIELFHKSGGDGHESFLTFEKQ